LLAELSDEDLAQLAERLAPLLASRLQSNANSDGWLRGGAEIASYLNCPPSRVYALVSQRKLPVERDGQALIARRSELDKWFSAGGARRT
jgi:excisionase family DNA binding protein